MGISLSVKFCADLKEPGVVKQQAIPTLLRRLRQRMTTDKQLWILATLTRCRQR